MSPVGGSRHYEGPDLGSAPWKCPACAAENAGPLAAGCTVCGSGSAPARHVGVAPPTVEDLRLSQAQLESGLVLLANDRVRAQETYEAARQWVAGHADADPFQAFIAGYQLASAQAQARTLTAPPTTAATLAPEGKARRTIIAALELFTDQVLRDATDEISSGEWCSVEEAETLLHQLKREEEER